MVSIETELFWWAVVNGIPAGLGGILFLIAPAIRPWVVARRPVGEGHRAGEGTWLSRRWAALLDTVAWWDVRFAWNIGSRDWARLLGVGYVFRGLLFVVVILATSWADIRWLVVGNVLFAAVLLLVTLVWGDRFHWNRTSAWVWLFLYIEEPIWMITIVQRAEASATIPSGPGLDPVLIAFLLAQAALSSAAAVWLFFRKAREPDLVSPRVMAGFALGWAGWCVSLALAPRWEDAVWGLALNAIWLIGILWVFLRGRARIGSGGEST